MYKNNFEINIIEVWNYMDKKCFNLILCIKC